MHCMTENVYNPVKDWHPIKQNIHSSNGRPQVPVSSTQVPNTCALTTVNLGCKTEKEFPAETHLRFLYMLEKIGKSCSSFPTCGVYTQVPPTLGAFSHTTGIMPGVAEMWRAAQSPPAPAPITPTTFIICERNQKSKACEVLDCLLKKMLCIKQS